MSRVSTALLASALLAGCAGAPTTPPEAPVADASAPEPTADPVADGDEDLDGGYEDTELAQAEGTQVMEIEAEDLGGNLDTVTAEPKRPQLPSMMKDIRMGPSG